MKVRKFAILLSLLAFGLGLLHQVRVRSPRQLLLRTLKSTGQVLSPVLTVLGVTGAVMGTLTRSPAAVVCGWLGAVLSLDYIQRVSNAPATSTTQQRENPLLVPQTRPSWMHLDQRIKRQVFRHLQMRAAHQSISQVAVRGLTLRSQARWQRDIPFWQDPASGETLCCDLWRPPSGIRHSGTAILYLHGGGFFASHKDFGTRYFFNYLACHGHVVMDADYRLAPEVDLLTIQSDARRALAWLKANAASLGADPQRVVIIGGSAGALLALLLAYTPGNLALTPPDLAQTDLKVQGVVSFYGITHLVDFYQKIAPLMDIPTRFEPTPEMFDRPLARLGARAGAWIKGADPQAMQLYLRENASMLRIGPRRGMKILLGGLPEEVPDRYELFSPLSHAGPNCPPTLLFQGEHDYLLSTAGPRALYQRLSQGGAKATYVEFPCTEHTFDLFLPRISPPARASLQHLNRFLASL